MLLDFEQFGTGEVRLEEGSILLGADLCFDELCKRTEGSTADQQQSDQSLSSIDMDVNYYDTVVFWHFDNKSTWFLTYSLSTVIRHMYFITKSKICSYYAEYLPYIYPQYANFEYRPKKIVRNFSLVWFQSIDRTIPHWALKKSITKYQNFLSLALGQIQKNIYK